MKRETKLLKNTAILSIGLICTKGVSFLLLPLYTALLSTADYGTFDFIYTLVSLVAYTLTLQFEQGVFRYLIDCRGDKEAQKKYISTTFAFIGAISLIGIIISLVVCRLTHFEYTLYFVLSILTTVFNSITCQIARGIDRTVDYTIGSFIFATSQVVLNVLFIVVFKWHVGGLLTSFIIGNILCTAFLFVKCKIFGFFSLKSLDKSCLTELLKYSLPMVPSTLGWWLVNYSDRIIILHFLGAGANGIYAVANKFPTAFSSVSRMFQLSWSENAAEANSSTDRDNYFSKIMNQSICVIIYLSACIIAILPFVFSILINKNYAESYLNIMILLVAAIFSVWANLYNSVFGALKYTKIIALTTVFAAIVNIGVNLAFINKIGLFAASVSTLCAYLVITVISHIIIIKKVKIKYVATDLILAFSALGAGCAAYCIRNVLLSLIITIAIGLLTLIKNKNIIIMLTNRIKGLIRKKSPSDKNEK
ncbi:MAG: oligosaccharide flippase family protein [Eubacterium sp.]|nr:oligosaccharide flippase family protein [Eubacterium sp.]